MAYQFENQTLASFRYQTDEKALTISNISGKLENATKFANGLAGLFWIGNQQAKWDAEEGYRTVKQNVVYQEEG